MAKLTRRQLVGASAGSILLGTSANVWAKAAPQFTAVRIWPASSYTRITMEASEAVKYKHFTLDNPNRLVIDLDGVTPTAVLQSLGQKVRADDPYIASLRVGQYNPTTVRVVIDLKAPVNHKYSPLTPLPIFGIVLWSTSIQPQDRQPRKTIR